MRKTVLISLCVAAAIILVSCEKMGSENPVAINLDGSTKMKIAMQVNPDLGVVAGEVTIGKGDVVHTQSFEFDNGTASVLFTDLQPGIWQISVELYDEDGHVLYEGSGEAEVVGGQTTTATIVVEEASGDLEVIIELPPDGEDGLIAYYPFSGSADDHSGNGYHGEVFGATLTYDRFGNPNSAYDFDGIDNYISVSETNPFMLTSWTITVWFKADAVDQGDQAIVTKHHNEYGKYNFYTGLGAVDRSLKGQYETCDSEFDHPIFWDPVIDGEWYFLAYTRDHTTGTVKVYVNDLGAVDSGTYSDEPCADAFPLLIGRLSYGYYFNGAIDDVRIYDRALSAMEIEELYDDSGLLAHYPFTGSADDHSGNGYHGEVFGATLTDDRFGTPNSAYSFDGVDDYIQILAIEPFMLISWTITAWFKTSTDDIESICVVGKPEDPATDHSNFQVEIKTGADYYNAICTNYEDCDDQNYWLWGNTVASGEWYFVAFTRDHASRDTRLYVNDYGAIDSEVYPAEPCANFIPLLIGKSYILDREFEGVIDDVRLYDRPLTAEEVQALFEEVP